jgi:hypothetical protein
MIDCYSARVDTRDPRHDRDPNSSPP